MKNRPHYFNNNKPQKPVVRNRKEADGLIHFSHKLNRLLTLTVLHFKFGFGKKRLARFMEHYDDLVDSYARGYVSIDDLNKDLEDHTGWREF